MFGICIESSHSRGMGHLFRALNFIEQLVKSEENYIVFINNDQIAQDYLRANCINYETCDLNDLESNWESQLIHKYQIDVWINDRLDTEYSHAQKIIQSQIFLVTFDDRGGGAQLSDIHIGGLCFEPGEKLGGKNVFTGTDYLVLNKEIDLFKRTRKKHRRTLVSLGGSDTYGVTLNVVALLRQHSIPATIITGPSFSHMDQLIALTDANYPIKKTVPSLIEEFFTYDLAITGGGVTPFEANASGLPCIIIANEQHEIPAALHLAKLQCSFFAGHHTNIKEDIFNERLPLEEMSIAGQRCISTSGAENIYQKILHLR